jgi:hypothetical protein
MMWRSIEILVKLTGKKSPEKDKKVVLFLD